MGKKKIKNNKNYKEPIETKFQKGILIILCLMSMQPLVGITSNLDARTQDTLLVSINNFFLFKSELIRYDGYAALLVAILFLILKERVSAVESIKSVYRKKPWNIFFSLLLVWVFINAFCVMPVIEYALNGDAYRYEGIFSILAYVGFFAAASMVTDEKYKRFWMNYSLVCSSILAVLSLHSLWAENPLFIKYMNRQILGTGPLSSTFPQFNHYGYYLCMMTVLAGALAVKADTLKKRIIYYSVFAFHQFTLATNGTRGAFLGALFGLLFFTVFEVIRKEKNKKQLVVVWCIFVIVAVLASYSTSSRIGSIVTDLSSVVAQEDNAGDAGSGRWTLWTNGIELVKMHPITGHGLNSAYYVMQAYRGIADMPHNEYLQHAIDLGLVGLGLYLGALLSLFAYAMKKLKQLPDMVLISGCCAVAYAVSAFFGVTIVEVLPFFYIFLGFVKWSEKKEEIS